MTKWPFHSIKLKDVEWDKGAFLGLPWWLSGKEFAYSAGDTGDTGLIPGLGRCLGGGHGTHSSILAWRIPWMVGPGGLWSVRVGYN